MLAAYQWLKNFPPQIVLTSLFQPIFNLADASISVGVIAILIFQKRYFKHEVPEVSSPNSEMVEE